MLTFSLVCGSLIMVAIIWFAYNLIRASSKETPDSAQIANVGDLNKNNTLGKFGIDGL
jgi:hypothetical protein